MRCGLQSAGMADLSPRLIALLCGPPRLLASVVTKGVSRRFDDVGLLPMPRCATMAMTSGRIEPP